MVVEAEVEGRKPRTRAGRHAATRTGRSQTYRVKFVYVSYCVLCYNRPNNLSVKMSPIVGALVFDCSTMRLFWSFVNACAKSYMIWIYEHI